MCSLCRLPVAKNHNFGQILTLFGAPAPTPFYRWWPNLVCYSRLTVYVYTYAKFGLDWFIRFCRPLAAKIPNFCRFWIRHLVMSPIGIDLRKLSTGALRSSSVQRHQNRFCTLMPSWRNRAHKLWRSKAWRTNKQTDKKLNVFGHLGGKWNPSTTKLGTMIEDLEHVIGPRKLLGVWRIVSPLWGAENVGVTRPPELKTPITP